MAEVAMVDGVTYDTGALIAAERGDRLMWTTHRAALARGIAPTVPAGVLAEAWRGGPQPLLSRLLRGCVVEPLTGAEAREVGSLAARCGLSDVVDLAVAVGAVRRGDAVITSNRIDIERAAAGLDARLVVQDV